MFNALDKAVSYPAKLVEIVTPGTTVRLITAPADETYGGNTYYAEHSDWGAIKEIPEVDLSLGTLTAGWQISFTGTPWWLNKAREYTTQGSIIRVYFCEIDPNNGIINVQLIMMGRLNRVEIAHGYAPLIKYEVSKAVDFLGDANILLRLSPEGQRKLDPTDKFCDFMNDSTQTLPWGGLNATRPVLRAT